jgi:hypothetical protein
MTKNEEDLIEIKADGIVKETEAAVLLDFGDKRVWLPKSQIDMRDWSSIMGIPQWLAEKKGLI